jgi:hypothetical protein
MIREFVAGVGDPGRAFLQLHAKSTPCEIHPKTLVAVFAKTFGARRRPCVAFRERNRRLTPLVIF